MHIPKIGVGHGRILAIKNRGVLIVRFHCETEAQEMELLSGLIVVKKFLSMVVLLKSY